MAWFLKVDMSEATRLTRLGRLGEAMTVLRGGAPRQPGLGTPQPRRPQRSSIGNHRLGPVCRGQRPRTVWRAAERDTAALSSRDCASISAFRVLGGVWKPCPRSRSDPPLFPVRQAGRRLRRRRAPRNHGHVVVMSPEPRPIPPTLAAETLRELHDLTISRETLRAWMITHGLWRDRRARRSKVYQPRYRRDSFGALVQIDGSEHRWFDERGPCAPCCCSSTTPPAG
jgi:hypothetical protein